jgi:hypothetical protein
MPRFTLETGGDWLLICEGPSRAGPEISAFAADSPGGGGNAQGPVHGLFRTIIAALTALMLWCALAVATDWSQSRVEVAAKSAFVAGSRALGHQAKAVGPGSDARHLVIRQPE